MEWYSVTIGIRTGVRSWSKTGANKMTGAAANMIETAWEAKALMQKEAAQG
jgi:hypothetical protein